MGTFMKGAPLSKADIAAEGTPFILYGELYTTYSEVAYEIQRKTDKEVEPQFYSRIGDVIMPTSGETPEDIATATCVMTPNVILAGDLLIYRTSAVDGRIISYAIKNKVNKQIASVAQGKSVVHVRAEELGKVIINYPTKAEQEKIITMLALLEKKLVLQKRIIETLKKYKRGLLQQIFSRKLIMTMGDESWEYIPLGEIGCFFGGLTGKSKEDFDHGDSKFITYMNVYKNTFADETMVTAVDVAPNEKQNAVQYGDILFTQSSETVEEVGLSSVWVHDATPYLNSFCMALRPHSLEKFNPYYLGYVLRSPKIREAIMKEGQGISRINLAASRIENIPIPIPPVAVQIKIADYLKKWDDRIYANEKTLTELISLKKALLQQLFI